MEQPKLRFILHGLLFDDFPIFQVMCSTKSLLSQYNATSLGPQERKIDWCTPNQLKMKHISPSVNP